MKKQAKLSGIKLQLAIRSVAEQERTEKELAVFLGIKLSALKALLADPSFIKRVEKERENMRLEKAIRAALPSLLPNSVEQN
ncbi:MAG TPA: hypothetical protein VI320_20470 [Terracidiphilus sp.]|jgi:hypothetical protein